jgi:hypothetical protein
MRPARFQAVARRPILRKRRNVRFVDKVYNALPVRQVASPCAGDIKLGDCESHAASAAKVPAKPMHVVLNGFAPIVRGLVDQLIASSVPSARLTPRRMLTPLLAAFTPHAMPPV